MNKIRALYEKYKEIILYIVFGGLTTVINYIIYFLMTVVGTNIYISNIVAWIGAVLFAYLTNRKMVFNSQAKDKKAVIKEAAAFYGARVFSFIVETVLLYAAVSLMSMDKYIAKLILQVIVIVLNYILSKFMIFK